VFVDFFIQRPVFATVCALLIVLAGAIASQRCPLRSCRTLRRRK